jgi:hypothetical protein
MRYWLGSVLAFFLALAQASSFEQFRILGIAPNLLLVLLVSWLVVRGLDDVLPMIAVSGVTLSLVGLQTPGVVLLALLPIVALGLLREMHVIHSDVVLAAGLTALATIAYESIVVIGVMASGGAFAPRVALTDIVIPATIVNVALSPVVFAVMRLAKPTERRGQLLY